MEVSVTVFDSGEIGLERLQLPRRSAGQLDVAVSTAAICGSDLHTVLGRRSSPPRTALGHEGVGHVLDVDDGTVDLRGTPVLRGDRVVFALFSACGECDRCTSGLAMKCRSLVKYGHESVTTPPFATGTLATAVRVLPGVPVLRIPPDLADAHAVSAGCAVATAAAIVAAAGPPAPRTRVLVFGAGAVGLYCAAMLGSLGCSVFVSEPADDRLALVQRLGARPVEPDGQPFPVVVEASGSVAAFTGAIDRADTGGRIVAAGSVSPGSSTATFDPAAVVTRRLSVIGIHNYTAEDFRWGVDWLLAHSRHLSLDGLVSPPVPLTAVDEAFRLMRKGSYPRVLVRPEPEPAGDG